MELRIGRVYDDASPDDGFRVLVDRLWPRGLSKEKAALDLWDKEVAPSTDLRKWWDHDDDIYDEFRRRYTAELDASGAAQALLAQVRDKKVVTLLHAARDTHNNAEVLADYLRRLTG